jgi:hypothetical protein
MKRKVAEARLGGGPSTPVKAVKTELTKPDTVQLTITKLTADSINQGVCFFFEKKNGVCRDSMMAFFGLI